ncbi:ABC transporter substrate-binding protein [Brucella pituitosa]|uniref:ABC transporter substrate-binding protein n=1 Tax=Brucella pituitosa TaxID=571256 RepID=UPI0020031ABD|nr:ABC transporter substrate-binding protein [Brucella pituitosa]MCK4207094.1 ABC transporter substrate-binding protein [Brucella pituitosa]
MHNTATRRTFLKLGLGGLTALPLSGILTSVLPQGALAQASTIRIALSAPPTTVDPHLQSNAPNNALAMNIFDAIVTNDPTSKSVPGLASEWKVIDDTHWEFQLRPDVVFSDGTPVTVDDLIASLNRATTIESTSSFRTYTRAIKTMSADGTKLLIETTGPEPLLPNSLSRIRIISAKYKDAPSADFNSGKAAIGTGPFILEQYVPGNRITLVRNEKYWGEKPPYDRVELQIISDDAARLAALLSGDFDLIEEMPFSGVSRVKSSSDFKVISGVSSRLVYMSMDQFRDVSPFIKDKSGKDLDKNPLKDVRVRKALSMAINREGIVRQIMEGNAQAASQFLPKGAPGTSQDIDIEKYDVAAAKALLAEAGYPDGFRMTIHGPNDRYVNDGRIVQAVAQMLTRIGIDTTVEVMPWSVYAGRNGKSDFSFNLSSWGVNTGETSNPMTALTATPDKEKGLGGSNYGRYSNPKVDETLAKAKATLDDTKRNELLGENSKIIFTDHAILPLHHEVVLVGAKKNVDYTTRADQYTLASGVRKA